MLFRLALAVAIVAVFASADTLTLRSGAVVHGNYAGGDTRHVKIVVGDHVESYSLDEVDRLQFGGEGQRASAMPPPPADQPPPRMERRDSDPGLRPPDRQYEQTNVPNPPNAGPEIPAGTVLVVRMIDNVDSERDSIGKSFRASIDEPVIVNGYTVIPRGADVVAKLVDERQSGKFEGRASLTLDLMQIQINGHMADVTTSEVSQASGSRGARTAKTVGGGAVLGAVLGGIFGGGKGAAIGAASGGTVGAGAEVLTHGQRVKIPSETRLSFTLQNPIRG